MSRLRAPGGGVDQRCGLLGEMLIGRLKTTWDNYEIVPLDKAVLAQLIKESGNGWRLARRRHQKAETIDAAAFLRPCYERSGGRRTSNYLDEVASSHLPPQGYGLRSLGMRDYSRVFRSAEWGSEVSCKAATLNGSCRHRVRLGLLRCLSRVCFPPDRDQITDLRAATIVSLTRHFGTYYACAVVNYEFAFGSNMEAKASVEAEYS